MVPLPEDNGFGNRLVALFEDVEGVPTRGDFYPKTRGNTDGFVPQLDPSVSHPLPENRDKGDGEAIQTKLVDIVAPWGGNYLLTDRLEPFSFKDEQVLPLGNEALICSHCEGVLLDFVVVM